MLTSDSAFDSNTLRMGTRGFGTLARPVLGPVIAISVPVIAMLGSRHDGGHDEGSVWSVMRRMALIPRNPIVHFKQNLLFRRLLGQRLSLGSSDDGWLATNTTPVAAQCQLVL